MSVDVLVGAGLASFARPDSRGRLSPREFGTRERSTLTTINILDR
jgi:hypothetical protein